jgi:hypothetical protein
MITWIKDRFHYLMFAWTSSWLGWYMAQAITVGGPAYIAACVMMLAFHTSVVWLLIALELGAT